ncbi:extracellular matrix regulator RemB [Effusibacillus pohliae]|uniref:extracellular matrix regulator RemB n=1 Tax=Effusibacillus pohliae TaxID=232270 RepID=UPI000372DB71|nr:extracellular matrix/biofilm biosynthesis regulator RemA family protein [Effusibacillus pohliae]
MFIHLGGDVMVSSKEVIAIFDLKMKEAADSTQEFLKVAEEEGFVVVVDENESKSFVVTNRKVYFSPISSLTLKKRAGFLEDLDER